MTLVRSGQLGNDTSDDTSSAETKRGTESSGLLRVSLEGSDSVKVSRKLRGSAKKQYKKKTEP